MTRFTRADVASVLEAISLSAKMQGLLPWEAELAFVPNQPAVIAMKVGDGDIDSVKAPFLPEFEATATIKDVMRALTATYRVLRATEEKNGVRIAGSDEESPIYWDNFIEDDETPAEHLPYGEGTARIIDEGQGGVIAYCHVDTANRIVEALRK